MNIRLRRALWLACLACFLSVSALPAASVLAPIPLWPKGAPGGTEMPGAETNVTKPSDHMVDGRPVIRLANISTPTITVFKPSRYKANGAAVVVCPGGGYRILAMDLEGTEICHWLNSLGVTAVLLKYRVPTSTNDPIRLLPLEDAQRALRLVRFNADAWKLDPHRIGILGFSAGGHLTAHASGGYDQHLYEAVDEADALSARPDFSVLIYPAYLFVKGKPILAPELTVTSNNPPTFMAQTEDDSVGVESSIYYYVALKNAKVPAEMHLYPAGGHGYGLRPSKDTVGTWPKRVEEWLRSTGVLSGKRP